MKPNFYQYIVLIVYIAIIAVLSIFFVPYGVDSINYDSIFSVRGHFAFSRFIVEILVFSIPMAILYKLFSNLNSPSISISIIKLFLKAKFKVLFPYILIFFTILILSYIFLLHGIKENRSLLQRINQENDTLIKARNNIPTVKNISNDKLLKFYNQLTQNSTITGLPDDYNTFAIKMANQKIAKNLYDALRSNQSINDLPNNFKEFQSDFNLLKEGNTLQQTPITIDGKYYNLKEANKYLKLSREISEYHDKREQEILDIQKIIEERIEAIPKELTIIGLITAFILFFIWRVIQYRKT